MQFACYYVLKTLFLQNIILLVVLLLVVPTDLTEYTEAYGFKLLESTERIDAARHTTEGTELIACIYKNLFPLARLCRARGKRSIGECAVFLGFLSVTRG